MASSSFQRNVSDQSHTNDPSCMKYIPSSQHSPSGHDCSRSVTNDGDPDHIFRASSSAETTILCCQWCNECSHHQPLEPGMQALVCYCTHHQVCQYSHKRQYQCVCRPKPWEFKTQITRTHCRGVGHAVPPSMIQVCTCADC